MNLFRLRENSTFFHVILTPECNLQCSYCFGEATEDFDADFSDSEIDYDLPKSISYDLALLDKFCRQEPDCGLIFYGGESLLRHNDIKKIMDNVKAQHFLIHTNGLLLDRLEPTYVNRFDQILVSIDGDERLTDYYRGSGTFRKVIDNLRLIGRNGFDGELIARMTVMEQTDIYRQVRWLLGNDEFDFSSVHWQLNAGFWNDDSLRRGFKEWIEESYNPGVRRLVEFWVDYMRDKGCVLRLYPFMGIAQSMLLGEKTSLLRCGGGWINYAIQTDGHIVPCPTMWGMRDHYLGNIRDVDPSKLKSVFVGEPCTKCDLLGICGGRCLYANVTKRWNAEAYDSVCGTVRNLVKAVAEQLPNIREMIENGTIRLKDFEFMKFNGCEIIP